MTHTFDSEVSLHSWLLWPTVRCRASRASGAIKKSGGESLFLLLDASSDPIQTVTTFILIFWPSVTRAKKDQSHSHFVKKTLDLCVMAKKVRKTGDNLYILIIKISKKTDTKNNT